MMMIESMIQLTWIIIIYALLGLLSSMIIYVVWLWTHVAEHLSIVMDSDTAVVDLAGIVTFSGVVENAVGPVAGKAGSIVGSGPDGTPVDLPFVTGADGTFSVPWTATLPAGEWSFKPVVETIEGNTVTVTQRTIV